MALAFDAQSSSDSTANGVTSHNHTLLTVGSGSNRALVVQLCFSGASGMATPTVTWDSVACTLITGASSSTASNLTCFCFGLVNPNSGNKTLAVSWSGSRDITCAGVAYTGVDQTGGTTSFPNGTSATGTSVTGTVTVTSATGDAVVAGHVTSTGFPNSVNNTQVYKDGTPNNIGGAANRASGAASVAMTCTYAASSTWAAVGTSVKAASAATSRPIFHRPARFFTRRMR